MKQLQRSKGLILTFGALLIAGGLFGLLHSVLATSEPEIGQMVISGLIMLAGVTVFALAIDKLQAQHASYSVTPEMIRFKTDLLANEREVYWENVIGVRLTNRLAEFELLSSERVIMPFAKTEKPDAVLKFSNCLRRAASERRIPVNGVVLNDQAAYAFA